MILSGVTSVPLSSFMSTLGLHKHCWCSVLVEYVINACSATRVLIPELGLDSESQTIC